MGDSSAYTLSFPTIQESCTCRCVFLFQLSYQRRAERGEDQKNTSNANETNLMTKTTCITKYIQTNKNRFETSRFSLSLVSFSLSFSEGHTDAQMSRGVYFLHYQRCKRISNTERSLSHDLCRERGGVKVAKQQHHNTATTDQTNMNPCLQKFFKFSIGPTTPWLSKRRNAAIDNIYTHTCFCPFSPPSSLSLVPIKKDNQRLP
jgi:hypothetical protein